MQKPDLSQIDISQLPHSLQALIDCIGIDKLQPGDVITAVDGEPFTRDERLWELGAPLGLAPLGLDALDTLRIEAGLVFAGHEFCDQTDPFEAGIGFCVPLKTKADDFIGRDALIERSAHPQRKLVGLQLHGNEMAAHGDGVFVGHAQVGVVTGNCVVAPDIMALATSATALAAARLSEPNALAIGAAAIRWHIGPGDVTGQVADWRRHAAGGVFPLPHPSWRNTGWLKRHPWFQADLLPDLRRADLPACRFAERCERASERCHAERRRAYRIAVLDSAPHQTPGDMRTARALKPERATCGSGSAAGPTRTSDRTGSTGS